MKIIIKDIIGEFCSERETDKNNKGGKIIREQLLKNWDKEDKFEILFKGVKTATPSFFDEAFGKLITINKYTLDELRDKLSFPDVDDNLKTRINKSIEIRLKALNKK